MIIRVSKMEPGIDPEDPDAVTVYFKEAEEGPTPSAEVTVYIEKKNALLSEINAEAIRQAYDFLSLVSNART